MWNFSKLCKNIFKNFIADTKTISSGKQYISHLWCIPDIFNALVNVFSASGAIIFAGKSSSRAMSAIHGALVCNQKKYSVRISVRQPGSWRVFILMKRVKHICFTSVSFRKGWYSLHSYRAPWIIRIHKGRVVGSDSNSETIHNFFYIFLFLIG